MKLSLRWFTVLLFIWGHQYAYAQNNLKLLTGKVIDEKGQPAIGANVYLINGTDSTKTDAAAANNLGEFQFKELTVGIYRIKVTYLGYKTYTTPFNLPKTDSNPIKLATIQLSPNGKFLNEVQVKGNRPLVENKGDRYVMNAANSPLSGGNSLQLLKTAPFVTITPTKEIKLQDKNTLILIDNKPVVGGAVQDMLDNLKVTDIDRVELITNPSAKYDAAYGAVINIITKKRQDMGTTGNVVLNDSQGIYNSGSASATVTYKTKALTVTTRGSFGNNNELYVDNDHRETVSGSQTMLFQDSTRRIYHNKNYSAQIGADYAITPNQTIGVQVYGRANRSPGNFYSANKFFGTDRNLDSVINNNGGFSNKGSTFNYNINYHLLADSAKNDLFALLTYTPYTRTINQSFDPMLYNGDGDFVRYNDPYSTYNHTNIKIAIAQLDYSHKFKNQQSIESGAKLQYTNSDNLQSYNVAGNQDSVSIPSYELSTILKETIVSAYAIYNKSWQKNSLSAGLRFENTNESGSLPNSKSYSSFFPTLQWNHTFNDNYSLFLSYRRLVNRPPFQELLPYKIIIDQFTVMQGNINLQPSYDQTLSATIKVRSLNVGLEYTRTTDPFFRLPLSVDEKNNITTYAYQNINSSDKYTVNLFHSWGVVKWWQMDNSISAGFYAAHGDLIFGNFSSSSFYYNIRSNQTFTVSQKIKLNLNAYYGSSSYVGLVKVNHYGNADANLLYKINGAFQLTLSGDDLLKRNTYTSETSFSTYNSTLKTYSDSQRIRLGLIYKFGRSKINAVKKKLGNEDATDRI
jgi:hypothetical protein